MKAATKGHKDVVCVLLEHEADVNITSTEVKPLLAKTKVGTTELTCFMHSLRSLRETSGYTSKQT